MEKLICLLLTCAASSAVDAMRLRAQVNGAAGKKKHCIAENGNECWGASVMTGGLKKACTAGGYTVQMGGCKAAGYHCMVDNGILNRTLDGYYVALKPIAPNGSRWTSCIDYEDRGNIVDSKPKKTVRFDESADEDTTCIKPKDKPYWTDLMESARVAKKSKDCPRKTPYIVRSSENTRYCCSAKPESGYRACRFLFDVVSFGIDYATLSREEKKGAEYWTGRKYYNYVGHDKKKYLYYTSDKLGFCSKIRPTEIA